MNPVAVALAQDFAQAVIAQAREGEQLETFVQSAATTKVQFQANHLKEATSREARGLAVRLRTADGRIGNFATSDFGDPAGTLEMARNLASLGAPATFDFAGHFESSAVTTTSPAMELIGAADLVEQGEPILARLVEAIPEGLNDIELYHVVSTIELANSSGERARYTHSELSGYLVTHVTRPDDQLEAYEVMQSAEGEFDMTGAAERLILKVQSCAQSAKLPTGLYPVLFTPGALSTFHALSNCLNGKTIVDGLSSLRDARGQQALSTLLSITDDPTWDQGPLSYPIDDEGIAASVTSLVNNGVVENFIYDCKYGQRSGAGSTGNGLRCGRLNIGAGRSYQNNIHPKGSNTIIGAGTTSLADMIAGMKRGVIVDSVMGVHTTNPISGDFSLNLELALVVENGEIVGRLKDAMMAGNTFKLLKDKLLGLSSERVWYGSSLCPYFLVDGLNIATNG